MYCKYKIDNCKLSCCGREIQLLKPILVYKYYGIMSLYTEDFYTFRKHDTYNNYTFTVKSKQWVGLSPTLKRNIMNKEIELYKIYNDDLYRHFSLKQHLIDDVINIISINIRLLTRIEPYIKIKK